MMASMLKELPYKKVFLNASVAFVSYALWTYYLNDVGALFSALTQGSMSFFITFFLASILEMIHRKTDTLLSTFLYTALLLLIITSLQAFMHYLIKTENIGLTVLPSAVFGSIYCMGYLWHLKRFPSVEQVLKIDREC